MAEETITSGRSELPPFEQWQKSRASKGQRLRARLWRERYIYLLLLPGVLYFLVFRYVPMFGTVLAFKDYSPFLGVWDSPWVGLEHFRTMFSDPEVETRSTFLSCK
jgi:putative aldouronate transport system permease protein